MGILDMVNMVVSIMIDGYLLMVGAVYCSAPLFLYIKSGLFDGSFYPYKFYKFLLGKFQTKIRIRLSCVWEYSSLGGWQNRRARLRTHIHPCLLVEPRYMILSIHVECPWAADTALPAWIVISPNVLINISLWHKSRVSWWWNLLVSSLVLVGSSSSKYFNEEFWASVLVSPGSFRSNRMLLLSYDNSSWSSNILPAYLLLSKQVEKFNDRSIFGFFL